MLTVNANKSKLNLTKLRNVSSVNWGILLLSFINLSLKNLSFKNLSFKNLSLKNLSLKNLSYLNCLKGRERFSESFSVAQIFPEKKINILKLKKMGFASVKN